MTSRVDSVLYESIINASHDAVIVVDEQCRIVVWNRSAELLFGYSAQFMLGKDMHDYITPERYRDTAKQAFLHFQASGEGAALGKLVEIEGLLKDGSERWVELGLTAIDQPGGQWAFAIIRDIEEKKRAEFALQEHAISDPLTGIHNRREFQRLLEEHMGSGVHLAIIDIDHFKRINDQYGHPVGDQGICLVADRLSATFSDALSVARLGGEEFGMLWQSVDVETARLRCEALCRDIAARGFSDADIHMTVSIGLAHDGHSPRELFYLADQALYRAKNQGRDQVVVA